jgi:hypothetical protein
MEANMKHAKHSKPLRVARIALVLLAVLAASTVAGQAAAQGAAQPPGQSQAGTPRSGQTTPVPAGPSYGPVLHPQPLKSEPGAQPEQTPQAQEEKAGALPPNRAVNPTLEVDPSARPAPQQKDPAKTDSRKEQKKGAHRSARRSSPQRVDLVPPASSDPARLAPPPPVQPVVLNPGPAQINNCIGGTCTDTSGATYNTGVGNAAVNGQGRLCTRSGNTMQCF